MIAASNYASGACGSRRSTAGGRWLSGKPGITRDVPRLSLILAEHPASPAPHCDRKQIMGEQRKPAIEVIHSEVEILPPDHSDPESTAGQSRVWLSVDS